MKNLLKMNRSILLFLLLASCFIMPVFADVESFTGHQLSDDGNIVASYDKDTMSITVTGTGEINRDKWIDLAKKVNDTANPERVFQPQYSGTYGSWYQGRNLKKTVANITFRGDVDKSISLPVDSSYFFSGLSASIVFEKKVDVSNVENMSCMFRLNSVFNSDISDWDTSNVTNMVATFGQTDKFNQDLPWDTENVETMKATFWEAKKFNGDVSGWDVSNVIYMDSAFSSTDEFNGDISSWDTSGVTDMSSMFSGAKKFNGDISGWDTSSVTDMSGMFAETHEFNGDISSWDVSHVENMIEMFLQAKAFNQNLSSWDVSNVISMGFIFAGAEAFNGDISSWDTSKVEDFEVAFNYCKSIDKINLLNRSGEFDYNDIEVGGIFDETKPSFVAFKKFPKLDWEELPYDYWISVDNAPFVKENTKDKDKTFAEGIKYVLETQITSYPTVSDYEVVYTGNKVSMDDIAHSCKDFVGYDIAGTWDLDLHGHNGIDVGNYTATVTFTPNDTEKYRTPESIDININITKASSNVTAPSGLRAWKNQSLSEVRIPVVDGGTWQFKNASTPLTREGVYEYDIVYTPSSSNYITIETKASVEVLPYTVGGEEGPAPDTAVEDVIKDEVDVPESESDKLPFEDVEKSDWYHDSVKNVYQDKILKGTSDKKFSPKLKVTRGMMITSIFNMSGKEDVVETNDFSDIAKDSYYEKAVNWGQKNSIVKGYGKDFRPDKPILRQEMVAMLYRYRNCDCYEHVAGDAKLIQEFKDASEVSGYARDAMDWALSTGLVIGRSEDVLAPKEVLTRAELATILERFSRLAK